MKSSRGKLLVETVLQQHGYSQEYDKNVLEVDRTEFQLTIQDQDFMNETTEQTKYAELQNVTPSSFVEYEKKKHTPNLQNFNELIQQKPVEEHNINVNNEVSHLGTSEQRLSISGSDDDSVFGRKQHKRHIYIPETSTSEISDSEDNSALASRAAVSGNKSTDTLTRKRKRNPNKWKRNKQKILRMTGKEYESRTGKKVRARAVKEINCKCHYKCKSKIQKSQQDQMLNEYLSLKSERERWAFIGKSVDRIPVKRRYQGDCNKRQHTLQYTVMCNMQKVQVCKQFFLATYDVSAKKVDTALKKMSPSGVTEEDHRGHKVPPNKKSEETKNIIRDHIKSLPVVASHYCRSSSKRKYLPSGLTETRIYQDYVEFCKERNIKPEKFSLYKSVFVSEFNYGFHRPKKDQCDYCTQHKNKPDQQKTRDEEEYKLHLLRKEEAREHKKHDKARAKCDSTISCFTMDLEKILLTPSLQIGQLYYKKKLKTYNFTVYDLAIGQATNYMWHEGAGTKGASEIASCLWNLLVALGPKKEVTFYSDTASGQNRNSVVSTMFLLAVELLPIDTINQKFMESGHSEMECDSVHSTIEARGRQVDVFTPEGWYMVARTAKTTKPYHKVVEMDYSDFYDYKKYSNQVMTNKTHSEDGSKMKWLKVKWFQYNKTDPNSIFYKYQLSENEFNTINIQRRRLRKIAANVTKLYSSKPKIQVDKLKDLKKLCTQGSIPLSYHNFYNNLEAENNNPVSPSNSSSESDIDD